VTTFSQLVDEIVNETRRPDLRPDIANYLNQTIRELHFTPDRGNVIHYRENLREAQLVANIETGFGWNIPNPAIFQGIQAVRYDSVVNRSGDNYATERLPSRGLVNHKLFYYRAGSRYFFADYGGLNAIISLAYYEYPRMLKYYPEDSRPAEWDLEAMDFVYSNAFDDNESLKLDARNLTSNWLLVRWSTVISEGLKAKVYKRISDDARARTSYSLYSQLRQGLYTSEIAVGGELHQ